MFYNNQQLFDQIKKFGFFNSLIFLGIYLLCQPIGYLPVIPEDQPSNAAIRANYLKQNFLGGHQYTGEGVTIAIGDEGLIGPHIDFMGRLDQSLVNGDVSDHGDQVAGTLIGAGNLDPLREGVAPGAGLLVKNGLEVIWDASDLFNFYGVRITSASTGDGCNDGYTFLARLADQQLRQKPTLTHVFSAGNSGLEECGYGAGLGWGTITGGVKMAKNAIVVGNVDNADNLVPTSSRGPTTDGRLKPDIVAMGDGQFSPIAGNDYGLFGGTSAAAPAVAGVIAQLYQAVFENQNIPFTNAGLVRACLLNSADDLGTPGPDYRYGFGRVNARKALNAIENFRWFEHTSSPGGTISFPLTLSGNQAEFKVLLYWTDREAEAFTNKTLVNDLDLRVIGPDGTIHLPLVLRSEPDSGLLELPAAPGVDTLNNVEQVTIIDPLPGNYTLSVVGSDIPSGTQKFFVTYELVLDQINMTFPQGGESFSPGDTVRVHWDAYGEGSFDLHISFGDGNPWEPVGLSITEKWYDWVVPDHTTTWGRLRIKRGIQEHYPLNTFHIFSEPNGLHIPTICADSLVLNWDAVADAAVYKIYRLGDKYMEEIAETTSPPFSLTGNFSQSENWFSVSAVSIDGANSRRARAVQQLPGDINCGLVNTHSADTQSYEVIVYPNPTFGQITVESASPIHTIKAVEIYDVHGKIIRTLPLSRQHKTIDLNGFPKGIYLLNIVFPHQVITQKIVKL
ncbi:MAG: S8 family serine peptidase [Bacteroidota bacterium]